MADYSSWAVRSVRFILYIRISLHWISALPLVIDVVFGIDALYTGCCASLLPIPRLGPLFILDTLEDIKFLHFCGFRIFFFSFQWLSWNQPGTGLLGASRNF